MDSSFIGKKVCIRSNSHAVRGTVMAVSGETVVLDVGYDLIHFYLRSIVFFSVIKEEEVDNAQEN